MTETKALRDEVQETRGNKKTWLIIGGIVLAVIVIGGAYLLGASKTPTEGEAVASELVTETPPDQSWQPNTSEQDFLTAVRNMPVALHTYTVLDEWNDERVVIEGHAVCDKVATAGWNRTKVFSFYTSEGLDDNSVGALMGVAENAMDYLCPEYRSSYFS